MELQPEHKNLNLALRLRPPRHHDAHWDRGVFSVYVSTETTSPTERDYIWIQLPHEDDLTITTDHPRYHLCK